MLLLEIRNDTVCRRSTRKSFKFHSKAYFKDDCDAIVQRHTRKDQGVSIAAVAVNRKIKIRPSAASHFTCCLTQNIRFLGHLPSYQVSAAAARLSTRDANDENEPVQTSNAMPETTIRMIKFQNSHIPQPNPIKLPKLPETETHSSRRLHQARQTKNARDQMDLYALLTLTQKIISIKHGKVEFYEKKWDLARHPATILELASFYETANSQEEPWNTFPEAFEGLLAKLVQDTSMTETEIVKSVMKQLCPLPMESGKKDYILSPEIILAGIQKIATRKNYGIEREEPLKNLSLYRWEINELSTFPPDLQAILVTRREKRVKAQEELIKIYDALSEEEKQALEQPVDTKKRKLDMEEERRALKEAKQAEKDQKQAERELKQAEKEMKQAEKEARLAEKEAEKEAKRLEKEKRDQERMEKKLAKEAQESAKKKKDASQKSIQGFFTSVRKEEKAAPVVVASVESYPEYKEAFPGFFVKENATMVTRMKQVSEFDIERQIDFEVLLEKFKSLKRNAEIEASKIAETADVQIIGYEKSFMRFKILKFCEDVRPCYFGTWSKRSKLISGRKPFAMDTTHLDYEYDSEAEWEEDEPGEELKSEDDMDDEEELLMDDPEENDGWVVPHGYLSDDEGIEADHLHKPDKNDTTDLPKRAALEPLVPIVVGLQRQGEAEVPNALLLNSSPIFLFENRTVIDPFEVFKTESEERKQAKKVVPKKAIFPDELVDELIVDLLGKSTGLPKFVEEFKLKHAQVKKSAVESKIKEVAVKEKRGKDTKPIWYLKERKEPLENSTVVTEPAENQPNDPMVV